MHKLFLFLFFLLFSVKVAFAAPVLSLVTNSSNPKTGQEVRVYLKLDTENNSVNSFEANIKYDSSFLKFEGYSTAKSITPLWVMAPQAVNNIVSFSGVIPGGVSVTYDANNAALKGIDLIELIFRAGKPGATQISIQSSNILLNDGKGTSLPHNAQGLNLVIGEGVVDQSKNIDTTPPQNLELTLVPASKDSNTPLLVAFSAIDIESGISFYEVKHGGLWQVAQSPYEVKQKIFPSKFYLRVHDAAGNISEASINIPARDLWYLFILIGFIVLYAGFYLYKLLK